MIEACPERSIEALTSVAEVPGDILQGVASVQQVPKRKKFGGSHPIKDDGLRHRRGQATKLRLANRDILDQRTLAARKFDKIAAQIIADLGGDLSAIEVSLVESFCGATVMLDNLNVQVLLGKEVDVSAYCQLTATLSRVASKLGLRRRARDVTTPSLGSYLSDRHDDDAGHDSEGGQ
jgi:hypothetical protein